MVARGVVMPDHVEDPGGHPRGYWGMLLVRFFKGGTKDKSWGVCWLLALKWWQWAFMIRVAI